MNKYESVSELTPEQFDELKINYYDRYLQEEENRSISMNEIIEINNIVNDKIILDEYGSYMFTDDDFFCTSN